MTAWVGYGAYRMSARAESVAISSDGRLYAGLQDGRVSRMLADGSGQETFVQAGGRPLGMKFDAGGSLIVADAFRGLLSISPERKIKLLANGVNGDRMLFPNDLAIAADGTVWFSDASRRFDQHHWMLDFLGAGRRDACCTTIHAQAM